MPWGSILNCWKRINIPWVPDKTLADDSIFAHMSDCETVTCLFGRYLHHPVRSSYMCPGKGSCNQEYRVFSGRLFQGSIEPQFLFLFCSWGLAIFGNDTHTFACPCFKLDLQFLKADVPQPVLWQEQAWSVLHLEYLDISLYFPFNSLCDFLAIDIWGRDLGKRFHKIASLVGIGEMVAQLKNGPLTSFILFVSFILRINSSIASAIITISFSSSPCGPLPECSNPRCRLWWGAFCLKGL